MIDFERLHTEVARGSQTVDYTEIGNLRDHETIHKLRVRIRSDAFRFQCFARVERWDGDRWRSVGDIHHGRMATPEGTRFAPAEATADAFKDDRNMLLQIAVLVLS